MDESGNRRLHKKIHPEDACVHSLGKGGGRGRGGGGGGSGKGVRSSGEGGLDTCYLASLLLVEFPSSSKTAPSCGHASMPVVQAEIEDEIARRMHAEQAWRSPKRGQDGSLELVRLALQEHRQPRRKKQVHLAPRTACPALDLSFQPT